MKKEKTISEVKTYVDRISTRNNWKLHDNHDGTLDLLIKGLLTNFNKLGYFNCPCRDTQEDRESDRDIICPCRYAESDIKEFGHCYCALYFDSSFDFSVSIGMIPERRPENT